MILLFPNIKELNGVCLLLAVTPFETLQNTWPLHQAWPVHSASATWTEAQRVTNCGGALSQRY